MSFSHESPPQPPPAIGQACLIRRILPVALLPNRGPDKTTRIAVDRMTPTRYLEDNPKSGGTMTPFILGMLALSALLGLLYLLVRTLESNRASEVRSELGDRPVIAVTTNANFFGLTSIGPHRQIRGNGVLVLLDDELLFRLWLPRREVSIPLVNIRKVDVASSHLGKTKGRDLLRVTFTNDDGNDDSGAWLVRHLPQWKTELELAVARARGEEPARGVPVQ